MRNERAGRHAHIRVPPSSDFLSEVVTGAPRAKAIHVILDNLAMHKTQAVRSFLVAHPKVRLHFTPTYSSWLQ